MYRKIIPVPALENTRGVITLIFKAKSVTIQKLLDFDLKSPSIHFFIPTQNTDRYQLHDDTLFLQERCSAFFRTMPKSSSM